MGKTRKNKQRANKANPVFPTSFENVDEENDFELSPGPVQIITEQLQSCNVEDKLCALHTMSTICQNNQNIISIISSDIIRIAGPLLMEKNLHIRNACCGALRNLSFFGGQEVCENLVEQDILTPLLALFQQYAIEGDWVPVFDKTMNNQLDEHSDTFLQAVNLVWNLCESTSLALDNFNQSELLQNFIRTLNWNVFGLDISIAVAQFLLVISEDNSACWRILGNYGQEFSLLLNLNDGHAQTLLSTLSAGIMSNIPALSSAHLTQIISTLSNTLAINHRMILGNLTSTLPLDKKEQSIEIEVTDESVIMEEESEEAAVKRRRRADLPTEMEIEVKNVAWLLEAQRVASETLTNLCATEDEEYIDDEEDISDAESVHDYDKSNHSSSSNLQNHDKLPIEIQEAIKSLGLVEKLWQRAQPIAENVTQILRETEKYLLKKIHKLRISSILCLHNLCITLTTEDLGGPNGIYNVWLDLGQQVFQGPQDTELLEATTSLMRAALEHLRINKELFQQMSDNDLQLMLNGVKNCTEPEIRANWLRMLGILGCILTEPLVKIIILFIIETCSKEQEAWTLSEALDSLMDMFSDNDWHQIAYDCNLVQKSREMEKVLKNKLRQQKRDLGDRYPAVCTVRINLARFSKYIESQLKNFKPIKC